MGRQEKQGLLLLTINQVVIISYLPLLEQFFLMLVRFRLGLLEQDLANRFDISVSSVSHITAAWINLMFHSFKAIKRYLPWHVVEKHMPEAFKKEYPNTC